jgi:hypothetical protein
MRRSDMARTSVGKRKSNSNPYIQHLNRGAQSQSSDSLNTRISNTASASYSIQQRAMDDQVLPVVLNSPVIGSMVHKLNDDAQNQTTARKLRFASEDEARVVNKDVLVRSHRIVELAPASKTTPIEPSLEGSDYPAEDNGSPMRGVVRKKRSARNNASNNDNQSIIIAENVLYNDKTPVISVQTKPDNDGTVPDFYKNRGRASLGGLTALLTTPVLRNKNNSVDSKKKRKPKYCITNVDSVTPEKNLTADFPDQTDRDRRIELVRKSTEW